MIAPWWTHEATAPTSRIVPGERPTTSRPELLVPGAESAAARIRARISAYTPEWRSRRIDDAGQALLRVLSEQLEMATERANRLPDKAFVELLRSAGVERLAATPASVLLEIEVSPGARRSALVPRGFQVAARAADGSGDLVVFETERDLYAAPAKVAKLAVEQDGRFALFDVPEPGGAALFAFGTRPEPGNAFLIGLETEVIPGPTLTVALGLAPQSAVPSPVSLGGVSGVDAAAVSLLQWEALDGSSFEAVEVVSDGTRNLTQSGSVELKMPRSFRKAKLTRLDPDGALRWLRLRLAYGSFDAPPALASVRINSVRASATRTVRNEVPTPLDNNRRQMRLAQTPVVPGSLVLEVFDGSRTTRFSEVKSLADQAGDARVYLLDEGTGTLTFGDGQFGAALPPGFRNVVARVYKAGGGRAGAVEAGEVKTLLSSAPFVVAATNPERASGGRDAESELAARRRGPEAVRARGRAVTLADYALLAPRAPGALVERAHAVGGFHPSFAGDAIPGVVAVLVVPPKETEEKPIPSEATLQAVARYLTREVAPAGVTVVAAAPRYQSIRAEVSVVLAPEVDTGETVGAILDALDGYFDPLRGGDDGAGWPFGGKIRFNAVLRRLLAVPGVRAVPVLSLLLDGTRAPGCSDLEIEAQALVWPEAHAVVPLSTSEDA